MLKSAIGVTQDSSSSYIYIRIRKKGLGHAVRDCAILDSRRIDVTIDDATGSYIGRAQSKAV